MLLFLRLAPSASGLVLYFSFSCAHGVLEHSRLLLRALASRCSYLSFPFIVGHRIEDAGVDRSGSVGEGGDRDEGDKAFGGESE